MGPTVAKSRRIADNSSAKGLTRFVDLERQCAWRDGQIDLPDIPRQTQSFEQRLKYAARFEKLLRRPQADDVLDILRLYAATCIPIPRAPERYYWSVSCLPGSPDRPLARVNASWMELFALQADGDGLTTRIILHLSDFTADGSPEPDHLDRALLESCVDDTGNITHFFWKADTFGVKVRGAASISAFIAHPHGLRAIRRFNLTHMNRGRNAYQASHCYSLADVILGD